MEKLRMPDGQKTTMPARRIYVPYYIALALAFLTVFVGWVVSDCDWYGTCDVYVIVWAIVLVVFVTTALSVFFFRKVIIVANATIIMGWNLHLMLPLDLRDSTVIFSVLIYLPSLFFAGLAIKRCFRPSLESPWQRWRWGE